MKLKILYFIKLKMLLLQFKTKDFGFRYSQTKYKFNKNFLVYKRF